MNSLIDPYGRIINYIRISVTNKCNLRCSYCYPSQRCYAYEYEVGDKGVLTENEIVGIAHSAVSLGVNKIRLTGGEPLLRNDIVNLVRRISAIDGLYECSITTNGILLDTYAKQLREAGLQRVNISLDSLDDTTFKRITSIDALSDVFAGIESAQKAGLIIKINFVVLPGVNDHERPHITDFCKKNNFDIQCIKKMDLNTGKENVLHDALYDRPPSCDTCNKIRIASDGQLFPCLFADSVGNIRKFNNYNEALRFVVAAKNEHGSIIATAKHMVDIGG